MTRSMKSKKTRASGVGEKEHENEAEERNKEDEEGSERYRTFKISTETANELPKLRSADLPLPLSPKKRGGPSGIGKLAKRFWDYTFPLAATHLLDKNAR